MSNLGSTGGSKIRGAGELIVYVKGEDKKAQYFLAKRLVDLMPELQISFLLQELATRDSLPILRVESQKEFEAFEEKLSGLVGVEAWFVTQRKIGEFDVF